MQTPASKLIFLEETTPNSSEDAMPPRIPTAPNFGPRLDNDGMREDRDGRLLQLQMHEWSRDHPFLAPIPLSKALTADPLSYIRQLDSLDRWVNILETMRSKIRSTQPLVVPKLPPAHVFASRLPMRRMPNRPLQQLFPLLSVSRLPYVPSKDIFSLNTSGSIFFGLPSNLEEQSRSNKVYLGPWLKRRYKVIYREESISSTSSSTGSQSSLNQPQTRNGNIAATKPCTTIPGRMRSIHPSHIWLKPPDLQNGIPGIPLNRPTNFMASERFAGRRRARQSWSSSSSEVADSEMDLSPSSASDMENEVPTKAARKAASSVESSTSASSTSSRSSCSSDTSDDAVPNESPRKPLTSMFNDDASRKSLQKSGLQQLS